MANLELIFPSDFEDTAIVAVLSRDDSGFKRDTRKPLESGIEIGIAIAGLVVGTGQLAIAIWSLMLQRQQQTGRSIAQATPIKVRDAKGTETTLPTDSLASVTATLERVNKENAGGTL